MRMGVRMGVGVCVRVLMLSGMGVELGVLGMGRMVLLLLAVEAVECAVLWDGVSDKSGGEEGNTYGSRDKGWN